MQILGVRIDNLSKQEILAKIEFFLHEEKFHQIATVNPEFILQAQEDAAFKNILNAASLNVADGVGVWYAFLRNQSYLKARIAGVDLMHEILKQADEKKMGIFLAIGRNSLSSFEEIKAALIKQHPNLEVGGIEIENGDFSIYKIQDPRYKILFCNLGAPAQEKFINSAKNDTIRLAIGVGGSFDFLTNKLIRAPKIMRILGLEWLWRFTQEPSYRLRRVARAALVFPWKVLVNR